MHQGSGHHHFTYLPIASARRDQFFVMSSSRPMPADRPRHLSASQRSSPQELDAVSRRAIGWRHFKPSSKPSRLSGTRSEGETS